LRNDLKRLRSDCVAVVEQWRSVSVAAIVRRLKGYVIAKRLRNTGKFDCKLTANRLRGDYAVIVQRL
jgi:hypothetical protein